MILLALYTAVLVLIFSKFDILLRAIAYSAYYNTNTCIHNTFVYITQYPYI